MLSVYTAITRLAQELTFTTAAAAARNGSAASSKMATECA